MPGGKRKIAEFVCLAEKADVAWLELTMTVAAICFLMFWQPRQTNSATGHSVLSETNQSSMITNGAEAHGLSSAFFEHAVATLLDRISVPRLEPTRSARISAADLATAIELIESKLEDDFSVEDLSIELDRDLRTLTRAFRAATGLAPYAYLTKRRMVRAKVLLASNVEVTKVAHTVGYANPASSPLHSVASSNVRQREWRSRLQD